MNTTTTATTSRRAPLYRSNPSGAFKTFSYLKESSLLETVRTIARNKTIQFSNDHPNHKLIGPEGTHPRGTTAAHEHLRKGVAP